VIPDTYSSASPSWLSIVTTVTTSGTIAHMRRESASRKAREALRMSLFLLSSSVGGAIGVTASGSLFCGPVRPPTVSPMRDEATSER
jgi:hypothetical protein